MIRNKATARRFRGLNSTLFRKFATECTEMARRATSRKQRAWFLRMTRMWEQLAQSWSGKQNILRRNYLRGKRREGLPSSRSVRPPLPERRRPKLKKRQRSKIGEIRAALAEAGFVALDEQAATLGLSRSTAWSILNPHHRNSGLEASTISRILRSPRLFGAVQQRMHEYTQEKIESLYGQTARRWREFAERLMAAAGNEFNRVSTGTGT